MTYNKHQQLNKEKKMLFCFLVMSQLPSADMEGGYGHDTEVGTASSRGIPRYGITLGAINQFFKRIFFDLL